MKYKKKTGQKNSLESVVVVVGAIVSDVVVVEVSTELLVVVVSKPEISLVWVQHCQIT